MRFQILGSSSSGNSALIETEQCKVLVDVGFTAKRLNGMLQEAGHDLQQIEAVFITHEHSDHTAGLVGMARREDVHFYANRETAKASQARLKRGVNWKLFETGRTFSFKDLRITSFSIPHDAYDPVGFIFETGEEDSLLFPIRRVAWVTDLGYLPQLVQQRIQDVDLLVLEANYCDKMLEQNERRPWTLKQRIRGRHGHLSNDACFEFLNSCMQRYDLSRAGEHPVQSSDKIMSTDRAPRWSQVCLAHLSKDCNDANMVHNKFAPLTRAQSHCKIDVVNPVQALAKVYQV